MSFKEQEIVRLWGRIIGNVQTLSIVYKDGHTETINHENNQPRVLSPARRNLTA